jgi:2-iminoacetate synthase ThiH
MGGFGMGRGDGDGFMLPPQMRMFQGYMMMVEQSARMSRDASTSGVAAVIMAGDLMKKKGPEATIKYYTDLLSDVKDPAVERAIRFQLVELYKRTDQSDKALSELTRLITGKPTTQPSEK